MTFDDDDEEEEEEEEEEEVQYDIVVRVYPT